MKAFRVAALAGMVLLVIGCNPPPTQVGNPVPAPVITSITDASGTLTINGTGVGDNLPTVVWFLNTSTNAITAGFGTAVSNGTTAVTVQAPAAGSYKICLETSHGNGSLPPTQTPLSAAFSYTVP